MNVIYNVMLIYGLAFVIGMVVSAIVWFLFTTMTTDSISKIVRRETYSEMKRLKQK